MDGTIPERNRRRRDVGRTIRALRRDRGLTGNQLAEISGITRSQISRMENGWVSPTEEVAERLAAALGLDEDRQRGLLQAVRNLEPDSGLIPDGTYLGQAFVEDMEQSAITIQVHSPNTIPALLQTPEIASVVLAGVADAARIVDPSEHYDVAHELRVRIRRQAELLNTNKTFEFLMNERVLHEPIATSDAMAFQMQWLLRQSELDNVSIRLLPRHQALHVDAHTYALHDGRTAMTDTPAGWHKTKSLIEVQRYQNYWTFAAGLATNEHASVAIIGQAHAKWLERTNDQDVVDLTDRQRVG